MSDIYECTNGKLNCLSCLTSIYRLVSFQTFDMFIMLALFGVLVKQLWICAFHKMLLKGSRYVLICKTTVVILLTLGGVGDYPNTSVQYTTFLDA